MGLDMVELVLETEHRFNVKLSDADLTRVRTVTDLSALVFSQLPRSTATCPTAHTFNQLRALFMTHAGAPRKKFRPATPIKSLLPRTFRASWNHLRAHNPALPPLIASDTTNTAMLWLSAVLAVASLTLVIFLSITHGTPGAAFAILITLLCTAAAAHTYRLLSMHLPADLNTIRDLTLRLAPLSLTPTTPVHHLAAQDQVLQEIRRLTSLQLAIPLNQVQPGSDFITDLKID